MLGSLVACSSPRARNPEPPAKKVDAPAARPLVLGALHDLVPAAGLRWMVEASPQQIMANSALRRAVSELVPDERLAQFAERTGVDLRTLPHALAAGFDMGTLYLAACDDACGVRARERFITRLGGFERVEHPHPQATRVTGTLDGVPHGFIELGGRVVGLASPDLTLSRIPIAFALGKLKQTPAALRGAALSTLPDLQRGPLFTFYAPGPFEDEWARAGHGLIAAALAVALTVQPADDHLAVTLIVSGDFAEAGQVAVDQLERAFRDLSASSTGELLALERARNVRGSFNPQYLTLSVELPLTPLIRGLRAATIADVWEILGLPPPSDETGRPQQ